MINKERFRNQYSYFDKEIVREIIDIFIEEYDDRIEKINKCILEKDLETLKKTTHAFKGVIANFEYNCEAFHQIESIEHKTINALEEINDGNEINNDDKENLFQDISDIFDKFKISSQKLAEDLKNLRNDYE